MNAAQSSESSGHKSRHFSVKEIAETIPCFDPTDKNSLSVERLIDRVSNVMSTHQFEEKVVLSVYSRLKGVARMWLDARPTLFANWSAFAYALRTEFCEDLDDTAIYEIMAKTTRGTNESPSDYCFQISAVGKRHGLSDRAIVKHARSGMRHREFQAAVAPMKIESLARFRETITEFFDNYTTPTQTRQTTFKPTIADTRHVNNERPLKPNSYRFTKDAGKLICYNCSEEGHISAKCPKPQKLPRCKDCSRVHGKGEPVNCGKSMNIRKLTKTEKDFTGKIIMI